MDGAASEGAWGAAKGFGYGLGVGVLGGVWMAAAGAITGAYQITRGLVKYLETSLKLPNNKMESTDKPQENPAPASDNAATQPAQPAQPAEDASLSDMRSIFNTSKPKDIRDGLKNALSNVLKGLGHQSTNLSQ